MTSLHNQMLAKALEYANRGIHVIPLEERGKAPAYRPGFNHGCKDATTDVNRIAIGWGETPYNIGIATGPKSGLFVVDVDEPAKWEGHLSTNQLELPPGPKVKTGNGYHLYFAHPKGGNVGNKVKVAGLGIDTRSAGGLVAAPPSIHYSGAIYEFENEYADLPEMPPWLLNLVTEPELSKSQDLPLSPPKVVPTIGTCAYGKAALGDECHEVASAVEGTRNDRFNKACVKIAGHVAGGNVDHNEAINALTAAAQRCGLETTEIQKTLASGFKAGMQTPKSIPPSKYEVQESLQWEAKPKPIKVQLLPVPQFDAEMLPNALRDFVLDVAERMDNSAPDYVAVGVMVSLATVIGRKLCISPKRHDPWIVVPNLWGAIVGRPSAKKTPSLKNAMAPLHQFEAEASLQHSMAMRDHLAKRKMAKITSKIDEKRIKELQTNGNSKEAEKILMASLDLTESDPPICKRYIVNDATVEKLGELLGGNPMGIMLFRDELTGWLNALDKPDRATDRAFYLECWSGTGSFTYDRIGRGTQRIESATLSLLGGIQPGKLTPYLAAQKEGKGDDGLIERFQLMVYPDQKEYKHIDRPPDREATEKVAAIFARLDELEGQLENPTILKFLPEAQAYFNEWYDKNQRLVRSSKLSPQLESHLAKYVSLFASLALIIHAVDCAPGGNIGIESAKKAGAWCKYLESHARRVYALVDSPVNSANCLLKRLNSLPDPFRISAINNKSWHGLTTKEQIHEALNTLCEHGYLQKVESGSTKPAADYYKHPSYCEG